MNNDVLKKLESDFGLWTEDPEKIQLENPVLMGMFNGGLPKRSVVQIAAQSGAGKSTLAIQITRECLNQGLKVAYIDTEGGLNTNMLQTMKVYDKVYSSKNPNGTFYIFTKSDCGEVNDLLNTIGENDLADVVILDSLGALDSGIYDLGGTNANTPKVRSRY